MKRLTHKNSSLLSVRSGGASPPLRLRSIKMVQRLSWSLHLFSIFFEQKGLANLSHAQVPVPTTTLPTTTQIVLSRIIAFESSVFECKDTAITQVTARHAMIVTNSFFML